MTSIHLRKTQLIAAGGSACCAGATLLCLCVVILPTFAHRHTRELQQVELNSAVAKASQMGWQVSEAQTTLADLQKRLDSDPLKLQTIDHLDDRLSDITSFCGACGLEIRDLTPGVPKTDARFQIVPIHMTGRGDYRTCAVFLHRLHDRFPDVCVNSFKFSGASDDSGQKLSVQFELGWLAQPDGLASSK